MEDDVPLTNAVRAVWDLLTQLGVEPSERIQQIREEFSTYSEDDINYALYEILGRSLWVELVGSRDTVRKGSNPSGCSNTDSFGNAVDPITRLHIPPDKLMTYVSGSQKFCFDIRSLREYLIRGEAGYNTVNPLTRQTLPRSVVDDVMLYRAGIKIAVIEGEEVECEEYYTGGDLILVGLRRVGNLIENIPKKEVLVDGVPSYSLPLGDRLKFKEGIVSVVDMVEGRDEKLLALYRYAKRLHRTPLCNSVALFLGAFLGLVPIVPDSDIVIEVTYTVMDTINAILREYGYEKWSMLDLTCEGRSLYRMNLFEPVVGQIPDEPIDVAQRTWPARYTQWMRNVLFRYAVKHNIQALRTELKVTKLNELLLSDNINMDEVLLSLIDHDYEQILGEGRRYDREKSALQTTEMVLTALLDLQNLTNDKMEVCVSALIFNYVTDTSAELVGKILMTVSRVARRVKRKTLNMIVANDSSRSAYSTALACPQASEKFYEAITYPSIAPSILFSLSYILYGSSRDSIEAILDDYDSIVNTGNITSWKEYGSVYSTLPTVPFLRDIDSVDVVSAFYSTRELEEKYLSRLLSSCVEKYSDVSDYPYLGYSNIIRYYGNGMVPTFVGDEEGIVLSMKDTVGDVIIKVMDNMAASRRSDGIMLDTFDIVCHESEVLYPSCPGLHELPMDVPVIDLMAGRKLHVVSIGTSRRDRMYNIVEYIGHVSRFDLLSKLGGVSPRVALTPGWDPRRAIYPEFAIMYAQTEEEKVKVAGALLRSVIERGVAVTGLIIDKHQKYAKYMRKEIGTLPLKEVGLSEIYSNLLDLTYDGHDSTLSDKAHELLGYYMSDSLPPLDIQTEVVAEMDSVELVRWLIDKVGFDIRDARKDLYRGSYLQRYYFPKDVNKPDKPPLFNIPDVSLLDLLRETRNSYIPSSGSDSDSYELVPGSEEEDSA